MERNKTLIRRVNEAMNKMDLTIVDEFMARDYVDHTNHLRGREEAKQFHTKVFKDLPDFHRTIEDMIAEGDKVWTRFRITATAHAGKKIQLTTASILRIVDDKAVEGWTVPKVVGENRSLDRSLYEKQ